MKITSGFKNVKRYFDAKLFFKRLAVGAIPRALPEVKDDYHGNLTHPLCRENPRGKDQAGYRFRRDGGRKKDFSPSHWIV